MTYEIDEEKLENYRAGPVAGGGSGIRTHDTVARIHAFQACAFSHSAIPPDGRTIDTGFSSASALARRGTGGKPMALPQSLCTMARADGRALATDRPSV